ncbi:hypothetical protein AK812_SmicGene28379 [Symbiodinium microadriaticum]|uniref:Uncharacterized protein n=1 Tax=Symbiodinium microadriaticum TaxID=2951 RepID=A0A1Q9D4G9_SYMMI|nr:hypothetical protein AK812_SmicGene28379 [Symbiodinium microadriaticum]
MSDMPWAPLSQYKGALTLSTSLLQYKIDLRGEVDQDNIYHNSPNHMIPGKMTWTSPSRRYSSSQPHIGANPGKRCNNVINNLYLKLLGSLTKCNTSNNPNHYHHREAMELQDTSHYASQGPLLPPDQWSHNALGLGRHRAGEPTASAAVHDNEDSTCATDTPCEEASPPQEEEDLEQEDDTGDGPLQEEADDELTDVPDDDLEWDSDQPDTEDEDEEPATAASAAKSGAKAPKRAAGHGSQRVANKAKKSDVKKLWRELGWGKKPKWLSWKKALSYIKRGEQPPAKEPLPPTPSPQRELLKAMLTAHHYSYDEQGNIVPQYPQQTETPPSVDRGDKASNQAREDHAKRRAANPYLQPPGARPRTTQAAAATDTLTADPTHAKAQQPLQQFPARGTTHGDSQPSSTKALPKAHRSPPHAQPKATSQTETAPQQQQRAPRRQQRVQFQVPEDHREEPPRPIRTQNTWRKLSDSTEVQLRGDGVANYPVQIIDNRPVPAQGGAGEQTPNVAEQQLYNHFHNVVGDLLVVQPAHITDYPHVPGAASSSRSPRETPLETGGPPLPDISDLELQAAEAIAAGRAPVVQAEGDGPSMRSSVRVDDNSHDISWVQGVTPATLPPPMPLHPRTILSMRGSSTGSWRGTTWSPPSNSVVRHPARLNMEPTVVLYKTLAGRPDRGILPDGLHISLHPAGSWIATTRFELGFARTPRYWLVEVDYAPPPAPDRMQLRTGESFWLEWRGEERRWQRRPRFHDDIKVLGGFPVIPQAEPPRPPTPPQRRDPTTTQRGNQQGYRGFNPQNFVDSRPLRGRLISPTTPATSSTAPTSTSSTTASQPAAHRQAASSKAKPPPPPAMNSGSESETSWPSEDPPRDEQDHNALLQVWPRREPAATMVEEETEGLAMVQTGRTPRSPITPEDRGSGTPPETSMAAHIQPDADDSAWFSVAANFEGDFTVQGLLRLLQKILHEMLQQSFALPSDYLTSLAYHACYYVSKLQSVNDRNNQRATTTDGGNPGSFQAAGPTAMVFCITNSFVEAEAALESLAHHRDELPQRHIIKELRRAEALLQDGRAIFKSWAKDPQAPGAQAGTTASQNALDGIGWSFLALEEGGVAALEEALKHAWQAAQRCIQYMDDLLDWIEKHFHTATGGGGSPSPKRRRTEQATGSDARPEYVTVDEEAAATRGSIPKLHDVPVPTRARPLLDPALPAQAAAMPEPGSAPYNILRAQHILEGVLPFMEQQVATAVQDAHSLLLQWTSDLWGEPIVLSDSAGSNCQGGLPLPGDNNPVETAGTSELPPTMPAIDISEETVSVESHRRRRAHAAFHE